MASALDQTSRETIAIREETRRRSPPRFLQQDRPSYRHGGLALALWRHRRPNGVDLPAEFSPLSFNFCDEAIWLMGASHGLRLVHLSMA
jgi:hypothetical protein